MHKTRTPLLKWFWAIFRMISDKRGIFGLDISYKVGVTYKTAWGMLHKIRLAMAARDSHYQLAGLIQVDDAFLKGGLSKGGDKRGRGTSKVPVLVMAAIKNDAFTFAKMNVVGHVDSETIKDSLKNNVVHSQIIKTDGFPAYNVAKKIGHQHISEVVYPVDEKPDFAFLKWINIVVSNAKAFILGTYHGVQKKHLQKYLNEYCYRLNRRWWRDQGFDRLLMACFKVKSVGLSELIA